jgi:prepilin-type processing-associated H-X9-DG protein/prepilin-type N-terminal cleavage/methylation domain-containing protein
MNDQVQFRNLKHYAGRDFVAAFTLVELLIVIAILGILAALLLPALSLSKHRAQQIACVSNLHQLGVGLQNCLADYHHYPLLKPLKKTDDIETWDEQLTQVGLGISTKNGEFRTNGVWLCPSVQWATANTLRHSYCYNAYGVVLTSRFGNPDDGGSLGWTGLSGQDIPIADSEVVVPSDMIAIGDSFIGGDMFVRKSVVFLETCGNAVSRHSGNGNVVFCDGHVESPTLKYLFEDTSDEVLKSWNRDHQPHRFSP